MEGSPVFFLKSSPLAQILHEGRRGYAELLLEACRKIRRRRKARLVGDFAYAVLLRGKQLRCLFQAGHPDVLVDVETNIRRHFTVKGGLAGSHLGSDGLYVEFRLGEMFHHYVVELLHEIVVHIAGHYAVEVRQRGGCELPIGYLPVLEEVGDVCKQKFYCERLLDVSVRSGRRNTPSGSSNITESKSESSRFISYLLFGQFTRINYYIIPLFCFQSLFARRGARRIVKKML